MDELFRKAAAGYPLKTDNSDWDGLASRLLIPPATDQKKNKFNKYGLPLLLVLLMPVLAGGPLQQTRNHPLPYPPTAASNESNTNKNAVLLNSTTGVTEQGHRPDKQADRNIISNYRQTTNTGVYKRSNKNVVTTDAPDLTYNTEQPAIANKNKIIPAGAGLPFNKTNEEAPGITEKKKNTIPTSPKIYWGIVFGPGINRIKNQKLQKPGFDIGIIAGVSILKGKAAVESGLLYTQKYYFSDGKYFNMDKAGSSMPQGMDVMSLEGSSRLFELPVKFKYQLMQKNRSGVFISTGISSYLMTSEENDYLAMMNGSEQSMTGSYKNNYRYIAVMANIGAEYNYKTGKHTLIRVEPYIQIPLKGIGIGSMPVTTAGLHVGFMRSTP